MDFQILVGAGATLLGVVVTQIFAMKTAARVADRQERLEEQKWNRSKALQEAESLELQAQKQEQAREQQAHTLRARREEFLGLVLIAQERLQDRIGAKSRGEAWQARAAETASGAARKAYSVALLYLDDDLRFLARAFYGAAMEVDILLEQGNAERLDEVVRQWRAAYDKIESFFWHRVGDS